MAQARRGPCAEAPRLVASPLREKYAVPVPALKTPREENRAKPLICTETLRGCLDIECWITSSYFELARMWLGGFMFPYGTDDAPVTYELRI